MALEPGRWSAAHLAGGEWQALRVGRLEGDPAEALLELIERESALAGDPALPVRVCAPAFPDLRALACDTALKPLPIHVSYREDPSSPAMEAVVRSALSFIDAQQPPSKVRKARA